MIPARTFLESPAGVVGEVRALLRSRRSLAISAVVVVVVASLVLFATSRPASAASTVLSILNGRADVARTGGAFAQANDGDLLAGGDRVRTGESSNALISFFDGSTIELEPQAEITITDISANDGAITIKLAQSIGRTWSSIHKFADSRSTYEVKTPAATATVRGTGLDITVGADGATKVAVTDGAAVVSAQGVEVAVPAGTQTTVQQGSPPAPATLTPLPQNKLRFGMHSPAYLAVVHGGRTCGIVMPGPTVVRQIPGCLATEPGVEPQLVDVPNAGPGSYTLVIIPIGAGGPFTLTASGLAGDALVFNTSTAGAVKPGQTLGSSLPVAAAPDGKLVSAGLAEPVVIATTPVKAVIPSPAPGAPGSTEAPAARPSGVPAPTPPIALFSPLPNTIGFAIGPTITAPPVSVSSPTPAPTTAPTPVPTTAPSATPAATPSAAPTTAPPSPSLAPTLPPPTAPTTPTPTPAPTSAPTPTTTPSSTPVRSATPAPTPTATPVATDPPEPPSGPTPTPTATTAPTPTPTPTPTSAPGQGGTGTGTAATTGASNCGALPNCGPDLFGYMLRDSRALNGPAPYWLGLAASSSATRIIRLDTQDDSYEEIALPFQFPYYGRSFDHVYPSSNGLLGIGTGTSQYSTYPFPRALTSTSDYSGGFIAAFWRDLDTRCNRLVNCGVWYSMGSFVSNAQTIQYAAFEWNVVPFYSVQNESYNFEAVLYSDGRIDVNYGHMGGSLDRSVSIGITDRVGASGISYLYEENVSLEGRSLRYYPPGVTTNARPTALTATSLPAGQPLPPTNVSAVDVAADTGNAVDVTWTASASAGITSYRIFTARAATSVNYTLVGAVAGNATTYRVTGLTNASEYVFVVRAWNGAQESQNSDVVAAFPADNSVSPIAISTTSIPAGTVGVSYSNSIYTSSGVPGYTWSVSSGQLPLGVELRSASLGYSARLVGTPLVPGTSAFTLTVVDGAGHSASQAFSLTIAGTFSLANSAVTLSSTAVPADGSSPVTVTVTLRDASNNPVAGESVTLSALFSPGSAATITPSTAVVTNASGIATFTATESSPSVVLFQATLGNASSGTILAPAPVYFTGVMNQLAVTGPVSSRNVGTGQSFNVTVELQSGSPSIRAVQSNAPVTLSIQPGYGAPGAILSGTTTMNAVNGVATFTGLSIDLPASNYSILATSGQVANSASLFRVTADATPPAAPVITSPVNGAVTSRGSVVISGTAEPFSTVILHAVTSELTSSVAVGELGSWTYTWTGASSYPGPVTVVAYARDAAGNTSTGSQSVTFYVASLTVVNGSNLVITSAAPGEQVTVSGSYFPDGANVTLDLSGTPLSIPATTVSATRSFSTIVTIPANATAGANLHAIAGGVEITMTSFVQATSLGSSPTSGNVGQTISLSGTGWPANDPVTLTWAGGPLVTNPSTISAASDGTWNATFAVPATPAGSYTIAASSGARSASLTFTVVALLTLSTTSGPYLTSITASGSGFHPTQVLTFRWDANQLDLSPSTDSSGAFSGVVFSRPATTGGNHNVIASTTSGTTVSATVVFTASESLQLNDASSAGYNINGYANEQMLVNLSGFNTSLPELSATVQLSGGPLTSPVSLGTASGNGNGSMTLSAILGNLAAATYTVTATTGNGNTASTNLTIVTRRIALSPTSAASDATVTVTASGFTSAVGQSVSTSSILFFASNLQTYMTLSPVAATTVAADGTFTVQFVVPAGTASGTHQVTVMTSGGYRAQAALTVP